MNMPTQPNANEIATASANSTGTPASPASKLGARQPGRRQEDARLQHAERHDARQLARDQRRAGHRRERQPVEEAGLDVARQVAAAVDGREEAALEERHRQREGEVGVGGEAGDVGGRAEARPR